MEDWNVGGVIYDVKCVFLAAQVNVRGVCGVCSACAVRRLPGETGGDCRHCGCLRRRGGIVSAELVEQFDASFSTQMRVFDFLWCQLATCMQVCGRCDIAVYLPKLLNRSLIKRSVYYYRRRR